MTTMDVLKAMADGNPGAITVMLGILKDAAEFDPDMGEMAGLMHILNLDTAGIYGPDIWVLFKDVCGQDMRALVAVIRSGQMGLLSLREVLAAGQRIDKPAMFSALSAVLPAFKVAA